MFIVVSDFVNFDQLNLTYFVQSSISRIIIKKITFKSSQFNWAKKKINLANPLEKIAHLWPSEASMVVNAPRCDVYYAVQVGHPVTWECDYVQTL